MGPDRFSWPLVTLDFEASGLIRHSYPIEVGACVWPGPGQPARTWSSLIRPTPLWLVNGIWIDASERIHRIPRESILDAPEPREVVERLNRFVGIGALAQCDGGQYDAYWLDRLETAADARATFQLGSWAIVRHAMTNEMRIRMDSHRAPHEIVHRAGPDAEDHIRAFAFALGLAEPEFERIEDPARG